MTDPEHLTQRDRVLLAETIRRFLVADIKRRDIDDTYTVQALAIRASDLVLFADELLHCVDGDSVALAERVAAEIDWTMAEPTMQRAGDVHDDICAGGLDRLDSAIAEGLGHGGVQS